jgi:hypothetical protein
MELYLIFLIQLSETKSFIIRVVHKKCCRKVTIIYGQPSTLKLKKTFCNLVESYKKNNWKARQFKIKISLIFEVFVKTTINGPKIIFLKSLYLCYSKISTLLIIIISQLKFLRKTF